MFEIGQNQPKFEFRLIVYSEYKFKEQIETFNQLREDLQNIIKRDSNNNLKEFLHQFQSMKKPFANIGKLKKQKPQEPQVKQEKNLELQNPQRFQNALQRPPTGKLKLNVDKPKPNIYDAIRKIDDNQQQQGSVHKPSLGFKKNKLLKPQKNEAPNLGSENMRGNEAQQLEDSSQNVAVSNNPRPTPVFNRNKGKLLKGTSKQKPVISQEPQKPIINANRMAYVNEEEQGQQSEEIAMSEQPSKKLIKPNLFKGIGEKKPAKVLTNSPNGQQKILKNSQVYQEYAQQQGKKEKFNFQKMMNIQKAEINIQRKIEQVSVQKAQKQAKRSKELSQLLNLQTDLYEPLVSISSTTPFEVYISKIKAGFLKNSCDQAFDQKNDVQSQTLSFEYVDFCNQCPQDYQLGHGVNLATSQVESSHESLADLILTLSPIIEQLIKPSKQVIMPPTSLLAFSPAFKKFLKCPNPTFVYYSQTYNYSLVAIGEKLYICEQEIQCALDLGGSKLAGLRNGKIVLWNGENDRASHNYSNIRQMIQSQNFQLPVCLTNDIDKLSPYLCEGSIVALISAEEKNSFYSFDSTAKLVLWSIQKINRKTTLVPKQLTEFALLMEKKHMVGMGLKKRNDTSGIICWEEHSVSQKLQVFGIKDFYLPKRSNLVFCLSQFSTIVIFSTEYNEVLHQIAINTSELLQQLIIPQLQHQNRQISIFYQIYIASDTGSLFEVKFNDREVEWKKVSGKPADEEDSGRSKRSANVIYQGVNVVGDRVEKIKLFRDLKCTSESERLGVDLSVSVNNIKSIIVKNKQFLFNLLERNVCLV